MEREVAAANDDPQVAWDLAITAYLDGDISLGRAATLLKLSRFDLTVRFNRLGLPMHLGATTVAEARAEAEALEE